jgi:hypothetical protein
VHHRFHRGMAEHELASITRRESKAATLTRDTATTADGGSCAQSEAAFAPRSILTSPIVSESSPSVVMSHSPNERTSSTSSAEALLSLLRRPPAAGMKATKASPVAVDQL